MSPPPFARRRARRAFWLCLVVAVLLAGALSATVRVEPSPATGVVFAVLGLLLAAVLALATRLLLALTGRLRPPGGRNPGL